MNRFDHPEVLTMHVYRDDPAFASVARWFMVPQSVLNRLYVCSFDYVEGEEAALTEHVNREYPNCICVY